MLVYDIQEDGLQAITATVAVEDESHNFICPLSPGQQLFVIAYCSSLCVHFHDIKL